MKILGRFVCAAAFVAASCGGGEAESDGQLDLASEDLSSSCSGVMPPAAPRSWTLTQQTGSEGGCAADSSDSNGDVALGRTFGPGLLQEWETDSWQLFTAPGIPRGKIVQNNRTLLFPQLSGFQTLGYQNGCGFDPNCKPDYGLRSWSANGSLTGQSIPAFAVWDASIDLGGGSLLVGVVSRTGSSEIVAQRFSSLSAPRSAPAVVATASVPPAVVAGGVNLSGYTLVLWNGSAPQFPQDTVVGRWLDRNGRALTASFVVAQNVRFANSRPPEWAALSTTALLDNSVAVRAFVASSDATPGHNAWIARVPSVSRTATAVPSWLATRPDARVYIVRGSRAYALVFPIDRSTCSPAHVALFAPSGARCGGIDLDAGGPGPSCAYAVDVGRDGTLFVRGTLGPSTPGCKDRVFPALLK